MVAVKQHVVHLLRVQLSHHCKIASPEIAAITNKYESSEICVFQKTLFYRKSRQKRYPESKCNITV